MARKKAQDGKKVTPVKAKPNLHQLLPEVVVSGKKPSPEVMRRRQRETDSTMVSDMKRGYKGTISRNLGTNIVGMEPYPSWKKKKNGGTLRKRKY